MPAFLLLAAIVIAASVVFAARTIARAMERGQAERATLLVLTMFARAVESGRRDPQSLLVWHPLATAARQLFPEAFRRIEAARGAAFPFTAQDVEAAHARCTTEWLAWERTHDAEYKLKASAMEESVARSPEAGTSVGRARIEAVEREKLERYQQRYEEYIRTAKALQALSGK
jgi:hypothetical protein